MHIVHFMSRLRLADGGVVRAVIDLAAALAGRGHEVTVLTWDAADAPDSWKGGVPNVPRVITLPPPDGLMGFYRRRSPGLSRAEEVIRNADALHLHTPWDRANMQLAKIARRHGVRTIISIHGMLDDWSMAQKSLKKRLFLALGARRMLERADAVHCTAQAELDQARRWFPRGRGVVAPLIFDLSDFVDAAARRARLRAPDKHLAIEPANTSLPVVLFLSRLHYKKRPEVLIDAAALLRDRGVNCRVILAGTGEPAYEQALHDRVTSLRLDDRVFLVGLVVGPTKVALYARADVYALPTSQENFGFVFFEALAAGTPIVTTRGTDTWRELEQSGGAIIAEPTAQAFADAIASLLADRARARSMGETGRTWVFRTFDAAGIAGQYEAIYHGGAPVENAPSAAAGP